MADIREQMKLIERGVQQKELRFINRAVRCIQSLRKKTNDGILRRVAVAYYPPGEGGGDRERGGWKKVHVYIKGGWCTWRGRGGGGGGGGGEVGKAAREKE